VSVLLLEPKAHHEEYGSSNHDFISKFIHFVHFTNFYSVTDGVSHTYNEAKAYRFPSSSCA
jgi:hypothetical protein